MSGRRSRSPNPRAHPIRSLPSAVTMSGGCGTVGVNAPVNLICDDASWVYVDGKFAIPDESGIYYLPKIKGCLRSDRKGNVYDESFPDWAALSGIKIRTGSLFNIVKFVFIIVLLLYLFAIV